MAYIGNIPAEAYTNTVKDSFNGTGSATAFTLSQPTVTNDVRVVVENVVQDPTVAYSVSGTTLTFTSAPPSGTANIYVVHLGAAVMTAIPPSEIADATVFASNVTVQGAFTSKGIDDNATSTAMTLDASGNLLVGKTSAGYNVDGFEARQNGETYVSRSGTPMAINRNSSDGTLLNFYKSGTTVGSIGVAGSELFIGSTSGTDSYLGFGADLLKPVTSTGAGRTGAISLGNANARFKDLYLSGGVYLGGTVAANKLDDYEEGSWTPVVRGSSGTPSGQVYSTQYGTYTKIGRSVYVQAYVTVTNIGSGHGGTYGILTGLPFNVANGNAYLSSGFFSYIGNLGQNVNSLFAYGQANTDFAYVLYQNGAGTNSSYLSAGGWGSTPFFMFGMTYFTDA